MKEYTIPGWQANTLGLMFVVPVLLVYGIPYFFIWREPDAGLRDGWLSIIHHNKMLLNNAVSAGWLTVLLLAAGIVLHELIHGMFMAFFAANGWRSVSFGFNIRAFAPYAHCKEPLKPAAYRISAVMPAVLLGDIPAIIGWISGNILVLFFGVLFAWAAAGDWIVLWLSRRIDSGMIQDHPDKIGFIHIIEK